MFNDNWIHYNNTQILKQAVILNNLQIQTQPLRNGFRNRVNTWLGPEAADVGLRTADGISRQSSAVSQLSRLASSANLIIPFPSSDLQKYKKKMTFVICGKSQKNWVVGFRCGNDIHRCLPTPFIYRVRKLL